MAHNKSSPGIVTAPLPESDVPWFDLVFHMDKLNDAMARFSDTGVRVNSEIRRIAGFPYRATDRIAELRTSPGA